MPENEKSLSVKYNNAFSVVQANALIRSKQDDLTVFEAKLIRLAISQIITNDSKFHYYTCKITDLAEHLGIASSNAYREIKETGRRIMKKAVYIEESSPARKDRPNYKIFPWFDYFEYTDGMVTYRLSEHLRPYLLDLAEFFTAYQIGTALKLPNNQTIRLYELLASWQNAIVRGMQQTIPPGIDLQKNEVLFSIEQLKSQMCCDNKYRNDRDFVNYAVANAVAAINSNTLMRIVFRKIKQGRSIKYIAFAFDRL